MVRAALLLSLIWAALLLSLIWAALLPPHRAAEVKFKRTAGVYFDIGDPRKPGCPFGPEDIGAKFDQIRDFSSDDTFPDDVKASGNPMDDPQLKQIMSKL